MKNLYLVTCIKQYPAFMGDSVTDVIKVIVPAATENTAIVRVMRGGNVDSIQEVQLLYSLKNEDFVDITYIV